MAPQRPLFKRVPQKLLLHCLKAVRYPLLQDRLPVVADFCCILGLAQWEGSSKKYYFVQRATGHSQWEVPTQPALSVPTPDITPQQYTDPFQRPSDGPSSPFMGTDGQVKVRGADGQEENYEGADRNLITVSSHPDLALS